MAGRGDLTGWPHDSRSDTSQALPSADGHMHFHAKISFWTWWDGTEPSPPALLDIAKAGIIRRAEKVSVRRSITDCDRLRTELNTELMNWEAVAETQVHVRGHCTSVDADPDLIAAVDEHEQAIRRHVVQSWYEERRKQQQNQMCSLILDPLRATAWWLLDNQDKPEEAVTIAQNFQELRNILKPAEQTDTPGKLVDELLIPADEAVRHRVIQFVRNCFQELHRDDLAARLDPVDD
ncbi:hypothetical protein OOZ19_04480 [Saccharopolyspora sp. NFXS83]|uniref:hypothetical protein n=1 Tax=Saccharopolyspora sp. NFXS83 TaxID=2993560 RepID=UPI00224A9057|nr:hypothetical protein [Saccharopolyspora sp. NFXS83]MCX2729484.1 hypothetical protein [Saccharopolyspora sp. NFXS83]